MKEISTPNFDKTKTAEEVRKNQYLSNAFSLTYPSSETTISSSRPLTSLTSSDDSFQEALSFYTSVEVEREEGKELEPVKMGKKGSKEKKKKKKKNDSKKNKSKRNVEVREKIQVSTHSSEELLAQSVEEFCKNLPPDINDLYGAVPKLKTEYTLTLLNTEREIDRKTKERVEVASIIKEWESRIEYIRSNTIDVNGLSVEARSSLSALFSTSKISVSSLISAGKNIDTVLSEADLLSRIGERCEILAKILSALMTEESPHAGDSTVLHRIVGEVRLDEERAKDGWSEASANATTAYSHKLT